MFRYQILIEYVGTGFIGWQSQLKGKSVQKTIENSLKKILKEKISVVGQGRLDAGVHAISQSAHFDTKNKILDINRFLKRLNFGFLDPSHHNRSSKHFVYLDQHALLKSIKM